MKTRALTQEKQVSSTGLFNKLLGCFSRQDTEADEEIDLSDIFATPESKQEVDNTNPEALYYSIKKDISEINKHIENAFNDRVKSEYPAYIAWQRYLNNHSFLFSENHFFVTLKIEAIPELELIKLIASERSILDKFADQEEVNMSQSLYLYRETQKPEYKLRHDREQDKVNNIKMATYEFSYYIEKAVGLIQDCNEKINQLQKLVKMDEIEKPSPLVPFM